ncbi:MAG: hypothetical protein V3V20_00345, partial [Algisphaera sp.]
MSPFTTALIRPELSGPFHNTPHQHAPTPQTLTTTKTTLTALPNRLVFRGLNQHHGAYPHYD